VKIGANDIRVGNLLEIEGKLYMVAKPPVHTQPGKGGAFVQIELKDIKTGTKVNERLRAADTVEKVRLDENEYQYLYTESEEVVVMDMTSFEQIHLNKDIFEDKFALLQENMLITVESHEGEIISVKLPETVICEVVHTEPTIKGQTVTSSFKPAILNNGLRVMVPQFIDNEDKIVIRTADITYVERA